MIKHWTLLILCFFSLKLSAQIEHLGRYEIEHNWDNLDYVVVSNEEKGVLIVQPQFKNNSKNYDIIFHQLDKDLNFKWADSLMVDKQLDLRGYHYVGSKTYLLFQNKQFNRLMKIVSINLDKKELVEFEPKSIVELDIQEFEIIKDHAIIGGYIEGRPAVFAYDLENDKVRTLSNVFQNNSELLEVKINSDSVTFNVLSTKENSFGDRTVVVNTYDFDGNLVRDYVLTTEKNHQLLTAISSSIYDKEQIIVGLFCVKSGTFPTGLFVNHVDKTGQQSMRFYNFGEFETFLDHNGERRAKKLKEKALAAKEKEKDWRYKTDVLFSEMEESQDKLIILAEFFKPWNMSTQNYMKYRQSYSNFNPILDPYSNQIQRLPNGNFNSFNNINNSGRISEFDFTHAFSFAIDLKGNILWDKSMEIDESLDGPLRPFGAFQWSGTDAYFAFYHDQELVAKHLNGDQQERIVEELQLMQDDQKLRYEKEEFQGITGWYGNRFLVYGVQNVKGSDDEGNRRVFFLNSVSIKD